MIQFKKNKTKNYIIKNKLIKNQNINKKVKNN